MTLLGIMLTIIHFPVCFVGPLLIGLGVLTILVGAIIHGNNFLALISGVLFLIGISLILIGAALLTISPALLALGLTLIALGLVLIILTMVLLIKFA